MRKKLTSSILAMENIRRKPLRSAYMIILVAISTIILYLGTMFSLSLSNGLESLSNRLGADVIVVPAGYKADIESILLKGEPSTFYLPENTLEKLKQFDEIEKMTPQTYVATLSASCCAYPVQIIGIDMSTDFLISSWLSKSINKELKDGEVIVGNHVVGEKGEQVKFFGNYLHIVGRLEQTGMGFDATVFVNRNTARELAKASERIRANKISDGNFISCVMIKAKPGVDSVKLASKISRTLSGEGIFAMFSKKFINSISSNLKILSNSMIILIISLWLMSIIILSFSFTAIFNERKKEMAIFRVLGASNKKLKKIIYTESIILSIYGSMLGSFISILLSLILLPNFATKLAMPYMAPTILNYLLMFIFSSFIGTIIGPLSVIKVVSKLKNKDNYITLREESV